MRNLFLTSVFVLICFLLKAQYYCPGPENVNQRYNENCHQALPTNGSDMGLLAKNFIPNENTPLITIPVNVNIWRENDGSGNWWSDSPNCIDSLQKTFNYLNDIFSHNVPYTLSIPNAQFVSDTRVRFVIDTVYYYNNSSMAHTTYPQLFSNYLLNNYPERLKKFNYHLSLDTIPDFSGISSGYDVQYPSIVSIRQISNKPQNLYTFAMHMAHEFGHNFGLNHTYNSETIIIAHPEFLWDVFGSETQPWCNEPPTKVCYQEGYWSCNPMDTSHTCTNNIMGGTFESRHFSALQCGRIHRALQVSSLKDFAYGWSTEPLHIDSCQSLNYNRKFYQSIVIDSGITFTVECQMEMSPFTSIIVNPGGRLVITGNGIITNAEEGSLWQGIELVGDRTKHQEPQYQGTVELRNGAVIENAVTAIRTGLQGDNWLTTGGIIKATGAIFRNNQQAIEFLSYCDTVSGTNLRDNCSYFKNCLFIIDTNNLLTLNDLQFDNHVKLWDVKNVKFKGCVFENSSSNTTNEGRGIYSLDAGFILDTCRVISFFISMDDTSYIHVYPCTFFGFSNAVEVETTGNQYAVTIDSVQFNNNQCAIVIDGNNFSEITRCDINFYITSQSYIKQGLFLNNCTGYHVEGNFLHGNYSQSYYMGNPKLYGIKITNSGTNFNNIYRNSFLGLVNSTLVSGINGNARSGLKLTCNSFIGNDYDIRLLSGATIASQQGDRLKGADNTFISCNTSNFYNGGSPTIAYYLL